MADPTVWNVINKPGTETPAPGVKVTVHLAGEGGAYIVGWLTDSPEHTIEGTLRFVTDAEGLWRKALPANDRISPEGTVWRVVEHIGPTPNDQTFEMPDDDDDHYLYTRLTDAPGALASGALQAEIDRATAREDDLQEQIDAVEASDVDSVNGRTGVVVGLAEQADLLQEVARAEGVESTLTAGLALKAPLASPALTGNPTAPTPSPGDADTSIATTGFVAAAVTAGTLGLFEDRGAYDASSNVFPSSGGSGTAGAVLKGDVWTVTVAGTLGGVAVVAGDLVRALADTPGQTAGNWSVAEHNLGYVPENITNKDTDVTLAANSDTKYASQKATKAYVDRSGTANNPVTNAAATRPSGLTVVYWMCATQPTNLAAGDIWIAYP